MMFGSLSTMAQTGFIIGAGLLVDTFVVRTITVPAMAALIGRANWWPAKTTHVAPRTHIAPIPHPAPTRYEEDLDYPLSVAMNCCIGVLAVP